MKKFLSYLPLSAAALVALSFAACTDSDVVSDGSKTTGGSVNENAIMFSTYMGSSVQTRAGVTGSYNTDYLKGFPKDGTPWNETNAKKQGFGVFAYYTGTNEYKDLTRAEGTGTTLFSNQRDLEANFMFNQLVWWNNDAATDLVTKWTYSPIKYWPNEVNPSGDVDDQNNNTSNDPAQGGGATTALQNGGNVSFFAYAPYVGLSNTDLTAEEKKSGIVAINGQTTIAANAEETDPILTYKLPSATTEKAVDLLWGTTGINGTGVAGAQNQGVQGDGNKSNDNNTSYVASILGSYRVNADLTKQTTEGTISFLFKHALAKIGGSYTGTGVGDDEDGHTPTNGLMVILDIDDMKGAESGGSLEQYLSINDLVGGSKPEWNKYNTKVTINEIKIDCKKQLKPAGVNALENDLDFDYTSATYTENLKNKGDFNLATGQWSNVITDETTTYSQTTLPHGAKVGDETDTDDSKKDAVLSEELAEPNTAPTGTGRQKFEGYPIGVTTVAKNVYETEANPLVFIPGTMPVLEITITYTVRTYDPNLSTKYTEVKQRIKKNLYITKEVELNKQYNILMHLGLTSVKFTASVSDWETTDATGTTTDPSDGTSPVTVYEEEMEHVYLPINVGEPSSVTATAGVPSTGSPDAKLETKAFTTGSQATAFAQVTGMTATFSEGTKSVELSHVTGYAIDKETGNMADWITYDQAKNTFYVTANTSIYDREATLHIIYDNVADETYTVKQLGRKVSTAVLKIYTNSDFSGLALTVTEGVTAAQPSAATKYYTRIEGNYSDVTNNDATTGDAIAYTSTTGYTLLPGTNTTISGTTITTKQYTTTAYNPATRTEATGVSVEGGKYGDATVAAVKFVQNAPEVNTITLTLGGQTSQTVAASTTASGTIKVTATFKDSDNKYAGEADVPNPQLKAVADDDVWAITTDQSWATYADGNGTVTLGTNTGVSATDRTATITVTYNNDSAKTATATIKQTKP